VKSLERFADRIEEVGDCLEWTGGINSAGHPIAHLDGIGGTLVRRWIAQQEGRHIAGKLIRMKCGNRLCVHPEHMATMTRKQLHQGLAKTGAHASLSKRLSCVRARLRTSKLSLEQVREIRASADPVRDLSARYGVSGSTIRNVRTGRSWGLLVTPFGMGA